MEGEAWVSAAILVTVVMVTECNSRERQGVSYLVG